MGLKLQLTPAESQKKGGHVDKWAPAGARHHYSCVNSKPFHDQFDVGGDHCRYTIYLDISIYLGPIPI